MGGGSSSSTSDILPILEDEPLYKDGRCHGTRVSDIELHPGHAHPGENRGRVRCDHAAPKGLRANLQRGTFLDSPAAGAGTNRYGCDEYPHGISGSSPTAAGGAEGKGSKCTDMGSAAGLGTPGRRKQRERKRERSEGQGQIKDRQSRSSKGGARQGKEVRSTDDGEPPGSVTMRGEFQGPEKDLPLGKATGLGRERGASARSLTGDLLEAEASSPTGPDAEWPFSLEGRTLENWSTTL